MAIQTELGERERKESGQGVSDGGFEQQDYKKRENHEKNRTTFGTVGGLVTSSTMVPGRDEALGRHKSYKERMRYQRPI